MSVNSFENACITAFFVAGAGCVVAQLAGMPTWLTYAWWMLAIGFVGAGAAMYAILQMIDRVTRGW